MDYPGWDIPWWWTLAVIFVVLVVQRSFNKAKESSRATGWNAGYQARQREEEKERCPECAEYHQSDHQPEEDDEDQDTTSWEQGDLKVTIAPDTSPEGRAESLKHRDLDPKKVIIENRETGEMIGTYRLRNVVPDFANNPSYHVEPAREPGRWSVTDAKTGKHVGNFSRAGVQQLLGEAKEST